MMTWGPVVRGPGQMLRQWKGNINDGGVVVVCESNQRHISISFCGFLYTNYSLDSLLVAFWCGCV